MDGEKTVDDFGIPIAEGYQPDIASVEGEEVESVPTDLPHDIAMISASTPDPEDTPEQVGDKGVVEDAYYAKIGEATFKEDQPIEVGEDVYDLKTLVEAKRGINRKMGELGFFEQKLREKETILAAKEGKMGEKSPVEEFKELLSSIQSDPNALNKFCVDNGINPFSLRVSMFDSWGDEYSAWQDMNEDERKEIFERETMRFENEQLKKKEEARQGELTEEEAKKQATEWIQGVLNGYKVTPEEVARTLEDAQRVVNGEIKNVSQADLDYCKKLLELSPSKRLEEAAAFSYRTRVLAVCENMLDEVDENLKNDAKIVKDLYSKLANPYRNPEMTREDFIEDIKRSYLNKERVEKPKDSGSNGVTMIKEVTEEVKPKPFNFTVSHS